MNSVKHGHKRAETQSNGRANLNNLLNMPWDPKYSVCSTTPRFSYVCPEVTVSSSPHCSTGGPTAVYGYGYDTRTGITVGTRVGIPGEYYPAARSSCSRSKPHQRSGPRKGFTPGVGGWGAADVLDRPWCASVTLTTHSGPAGLRGPLRCQGASLRAKGEIPATFPES